MTPPGVVLASHTATDPMAPPQSDFGNANKHRQEPKKQNNEKKQVLQPDPAVLHPLSPSSANHLSLQPMIRIRCKPPYHPSCSTSRAPHTASVPCSTAPPSHSRNPQLEIPTLTSAHTASLTILEVGTPVAALSGEIQKLGTQVKACWLQKKKDPAVPHHNPHTVYHVYPRELKHHPKHPGKRQRTSTNNQL